MTARVERGADARIGDDRADTIAAIATPPGPGGIGIVRVSGPGSSRVVATLLRRAETAFADRRLVHGFAYDPRTGERLDEVLAVVMRGPRSYTGEDVGEIHAHGGGLNVARILGAALACAGVRPAEPGEFTRRAFENGRLDLTRAEAVLAVIGAASERALRAAQAQLAGALGARVEALREEAVALRAEVEASIDFPEEDLDFLPMGTVALRAARLAEEAARLAGSYRVGRALTEGVEVALVGAPNVGKSSLLNALVGEERAVVTPEPGTTRDYVEARVVWDGVPVTLVDTAGERETTNEAERRGLELGRKRAARADLIVEVRDAAADGADPGEGWPSTGDDAASGARAGGVVGQSAARVAVGAEKRPGGGFRIVVWNKCDLAPAPSGGLAVSARTGEGLDALRARILAVLLGDGGEVEGVIVTSERQRRLLDEAAVAAARAAEAARAARPAELVAADLRACAARLGEVTGADVEEAMLDALFARFCLGK